MAANILVIDDDQAIRDAFDLALSESGYIVRLADNGLTGIEMAQAERPDMIFLDLKMPVMNGVEALRHLNNMDGSLKIYIVTAFAREFMDQLQAARTEGAQFQLAAKPLLPQQIRDIAHAALGS